jgi:phage shock protein A
MENTKPKSFWSRPEGVTGTVVLAGLVLGGGYLLYTSLPALIALTSNVIYLAGMLLVLGAIIYMVIDPRMRTLVGYMYKSIMRWITGIFVTIDPIGILKNYVSDLEDNLRKMSKQLGSLRGQMRKLSNMISTNEREMENSLALAGRARDTGNEKQMLLNSRKAARLRDVNAKYDTLLKRMDILYKVLTKMYQNSEILLEDTKDQVRVKEQERKAIRASHSAMKSAMSIIRGDADKRAIFDQAVEEIADDVANKVGEMERFMELSENFMNSVDLQNGVFEEKGLQMLKEYEEKSTLLLLGDGKSTSSFDLDGDRPERRSSSSDSSTSNSKYDGLFED